VDRSLCCNVRVSGTWLTPRKGPARFALAVGAAKGGVGKSTIALNLALALRAHGTVGILDFDLYAPDIPAMVGIEHTAWTRSWALARRQPRVTFTPVRRYDLEIVSSGFILGEDQPMGIDPATVGLLARQLTHDVRWSALDFLVVDLPAGTSAVQHVLAQVLPLSAALLVVTPQLVAHVDARKAAQLFQLLRVPIIGAIENMAGATCPRCGETIPLFTPAEANRSLWSLGIPRLAQIPFRDSVDGDSPLLESDPDGPVASALRRVAAAVAERASS
jgi:ATP-binding protein involved in chromosome partitioning